MAAPGRALCESLLSSALSSLLSPAWGEQDYRGHAYTLFPPRKSIFREAILTRFPVLPTSSSHTAHEQPSHKSLPRCVKILAKTSINTKIPSANPSPFFLLKGIKIQINLLKLIFSNDFFPACCCPVLHQPAIQLLLISCARRDTN